MRLRAILAAAVLFTGARASSAATYQAETALLSGGVAVAADHAGYTGTGFVAGYVDGNKGNAATTFSIGVPAGGSYRLALRYANATGTARTLSLYVGGMRLRAVTLAATANWDTWATQGEIVSLNAGTNAIQYKFDTTDSGNVNLDKLDVDPASAYQAESAALSGGATAAADHAGYTGSGFVAGYVDANKGNAATTFSVAAAAGGSYTAVLRYANGTGATQTLGLYVGGVRLRQVALLATANWDSWSTETEIVALNAGTNAVQYKFDTTDSGNVNLDRIDAAPIGSAAMPTATTRPTATATATATSGTAAATPTRTPTPTATVTSTATATAVSSAGATVPFTTYEMEDAARVTTNGAVLAASRTWGQLTSEASGRRAVQLTAAGQYVQFNLVAPAQALVVRYSIPDTSTGSAYNAGLSLYVGGVKKPDLTLTNKYSWLYGTWTTEGGQIRWSNNPAASPKNPHRFFDELAVKLDASYPAGTQIRLVRESGNLNFASTASVTVDLVDAEPIPAAIAPPSNYASITSYGGVANDGGDDTAAMTNAINAVKNSGGTLRGVWIPEGTFDFNNGTRGAGYDGTGTRIYLDSGVSIRGAGMWRSVLQGAFAGFYARAGNLTIADLKIAAADVIRDDYYGVSGLEGNLSSSSVTNVWFEHGKVGVWATNQTNTLTMSGCRIRDVWADGLNLHYGTSNSTVTQNHFRNTGDDAMAMWSDTYLDVNDAFTYNTVQLPSLANGIAIYGGQNNRVQNNLIADIVDNGSGISFGTNFNPPSITGTLQISGNVLQRAGSWHHDYGYGIGAIWAYWLGSAGKIASPTVTIASNTVTDSSYPGILVEEPSTGAGVTFSSNAITNVGSYGVQIKATAAGAVTFNNNTVNGTVPSGKFVNESTAMVVSGTGNNW